MENKNQADAAWKIQALKAGDIFLLKIFHRDMEGNSDLKKYLTGALGAAALMKKKKRNIYCSSLL